MNLNSRNTLRHAVLAAALGAGLVASQIAGAQAAPGEERQPAGPPNAGDTRAIPGPDPKQGPAPRTGEERPLIRQPSDRTGANTEPRSAAGLGRAERRTDGPDAGVAKSGVKP